MHEILQEVRWREQKTGVVFSVQLDLSIGEKLSCARIILALVMLLGSPAPSYCVIGV